MLTINSLSFPLCVHGQQKFKRIILLSPFSRLRLPLSPVVDIFVLFYIIISSITLPEENHNWVLAETGGQRSPCKYACVQILIPETSDDATLGDKAPS